MTDRDQLRHDLLDLADKRALSAEEQATLEQLLQSNGGKAHAAAHTLLNQTADTVRSNRRWTSAELNTIAKRVKQDVHKQRRGRWWGRPSARPGRRHHALRSFAFAVSMLAVVLAAGLFAVRDRIQITPAAATTPFAVSEPLEFHSFVDMRTLSTFAVDELPFNLYTQTTGALNAARFLEPTQLYDELIFVGASERPDDVVEMAFVDTTKRRDFRPIWILTQRPAQPNDTLEPLQLGYVPPAELTQYNELVAAEEQPFADGVASYSAYELYKAGLDDPRDRNDHGTGNHNFVMVSQLTWIEQGQKLTFSVIAGSRTSARPLEAFATNMRLQFVEAARSRESVVDPLAATGEIVPLTLSAENSTRPIRLNVYLPPSYDSSDASYPTVYLLHGGGGSPNNWVYGSQIAQVMDSLIGRGEIRPMIVVMPPAYDFSSEFETAFYDTVLPHIDSTYRTDARREMRAVGGASVGGGLSLWTGLRNPELFGALGVWMYGNVADLPQTREALLDALPDSLTPAIYVRIGDRDGFLQNSESLHAELNARGIAHFYQVDPDGWHDTAYLNPLVPDFMRWFDQQFPEG